jgi:hypothetical protein
MRLERSRSELREVANGAGAGDAEVVETFEGERRRPYPARDTSCSREVAGAPRAERADRRARKCASLSRKVSSPGSDEPRCRFAAPSSDGSRFASAVTFSRGEKGIRWLPAVAAPCVRKRPARRRSAI